MYSRRPILNSLEGDRTPPATGEMGQAIQVRHLDLAFRRPDPPCVASVPSVTLFPVLSFGAFTQVSEDPLLFVNI